ncbi:hypothetical protein E1A91_D13G052100v1 [Gossypium mustelinum]|uniref:Uncharacterized protein n=1 Tax=Gossypium mustelinum TaxID=34275 RepID=A0A5D2RY55_GOSMU|nr:hypothetical protein E1A91_D13G052100v1 [Gossypium mustelinum]
MEGSLVIDQKDMIVIVHTQDEKGLIRIKEDSFLNDYISFALDSHFWYITT